VTLPAIEENWSECQECDLGVSRIQVGGSFVFGEGDDRGVMFIGEGPGKDEEAHGRPFIGRSGQFLRDMLKELEFKRYYITNAVCCRSWDYAYDNQGNKLTRKNWKTKKEEYVVKDDTPKPSQMLACRPRLWHQVYAVDPVLIVTLGGSAAESVLGRSVKIQAENGTLQKVSIPGAGFIPQLTPKGAWARKVRGQLIAPYKQNLVTYPVIPIIHPAFAAANRKDRRLGSPMHHFVSGLQKARNIYAAYMQEVYGESVVKYELSDDAVDASLDEEVYIGSDYD
jgi:uracil-DNA glycosylase